MSSITRREFLKVSSLAAAGALLTACQQATTQAPAAEPTKASDKPAEPTAAPKQERPASFPLGDVPRNRTLYYMYSTPLAGNFNPFASGYSPQRGNAVLHEPCAYYTTHGDKTYMWLAESYKYNEDATECTIVFKKGIKWSDGTAFTAADVAAGMERLKRVSGLNKGGTYAAELVKAEALDDVTLKVTLNQTDWRFFFKSLTYRFDLGDYTVFLPDHVWKDVPDEEMTTFKWFDKEKGWPLTTGPYYVAESVDQYTNYDQLATWWGAETGFVEKYPEPWRIQQQLYQNNTIAAQLLINKEIDQSLDLRPLLVATTVAQGDHLETWTGRKPPYGYTDWWPISVQFCTAKPPFDNPKVRWAIAYAIDRQQVVDVGWGGSGEATTSIFPKFARLSKYMEGIQDILDKYGNLQKDLAKTESLMADAGYAKNGDGFYADKDGVVLVADIYADGNLFGDLAPIVAEQLRSAGFSCAHKSPPSVWDDSVNGNAPLFLFGHGGATIDPLDTFMLYYNPPPEMGKTSWGNLTRWQNTDFKAITDEMNNTPMDDPKMTDIFHRGMEVFYRELPDCPLVQWYHRIPVNTYYWTNWPTEANPYMNSALWHLTQLIVINGLKPTGNS